MNIRNFDKYMLRCGISVTMILACMPGDYAPDTGFSDKVNHFAAFFVLCILALRVYPGRYAAAGTGLMLYGIFIEAVQILIPGRLCSVLDLAADLCGIAGGILVTAAYNYYRKKYK